MSITNQLLLFLDVVQQGSFTKAALLHDMDNSSLSKQIKKLEHELGVQLLNRSTRSFSLTSAGEEILQQTHALSETLDNIQNIADAYHSVPKGELRITSPVYFGQEYLQPVISQFMKQYPDVKINLSLDDKKADIIGDHFDLAFRLGKLTESNLIARKIAETNFIAVAAKSFIEKYGYPSSPEELVALPAVVYSNGTLTLNQLSTRLVGSEHPFNTYKMFGNYKVSDIRTLLGAVRDGLGYSLIDISNLDRHVDELGLVRLLTHYEVSTRETAIYAIYPHRKQTMLVKEFIKTVQDYIGSPPRWESHIVSASNV
ncbi:LysR family transcriptional regulator [Photobacterium sanguinicancri]|uniref:LysR family transcriptional regulator n=1 Tax=Photobacterium sanguinicancri TaxID=875932 RepID=A0AAW7Y077_9GAMM|nr:LysR family transcriptional regulator [Photobacterium sanguinicancri]MDO6541752.1 LysR family transcriptional regulator [Photobacterium sanguinicancri]